MIEQKGWHSRGYLLHFDGLDVVQFITIRLFDSVPDEAIEKWKAEHNWSENTDGDTERTEQLIRFIDHYNDQGHGSCYLRIPEVASLIRDSLRFHDETRYQLIAWCVMPNHGYVLLKPLTGYAISKIVQSWKSFTAHRANKLLKRAGRFWMPITLTDISVRMSSTTRQLNIYIIILLPLVWLACRKNGSGRLHVEVSDADGDVRVP